jgi:aspartate carbamoyltransferase catalytic subunit
MQDRPDEYEQARGKYIIDNETMKILSKDAIIMHPLPRVDEVTLQI